MVDIIQETESEHFTYMNHDIVTYENNPELLYKENLVNNGTIDVNKISISLNKMLISDQEKGLKYVDDKKSLLVILRGNSENIEEMVDNDIKRIKLVFEPICDIVVESVSNNFEIIINRIRTSFRTRKNIIVWYTGHGINIGNSTPSIKVNNKNFFNTHELHKNLLSSKYYDKNGHFFGLIIDACNSYDQDVKIELKSLIDKNEPDPLKDIDIFNDVGDFFSISSEYAKGSKGTRWGSYYTTVLLHELVRTKNWLSALYSTRSILDKQQRPIYTVNFVESKLNLEYIDIEGY